MKISSVHNKKILALRRLYKSKERKASNVFIAEGVKEVKRGFDSGFKPVAVYFSPDIFKGDIGTLLSGLDEETAVFELTEAVYRKVAYRDNTEGLLVLFEKKYYSLQDINIDDNSTFIVLESVEKPGNLGAVLRTAGAAGVDAVILTETKVDQYHPNVIRASIGAVFKIPVIVTNNTALLEWLKENNIKSYAAALPAYKDIYQADLKQKLALIFGTEADGLGDFWLENADCLITIPMTDMVDSLNVSVSVAVAVYETVRQKTQIS